MNRHARKKLENSNFLDFDLSDVAITFIDGVPNIAPAPSFTPENTSSPFNGFVV